MTRLSFYFGSATAPNVQRGAEHFGWMLHEDFELDLLTTTDTLVTEDIMRYYNVYHYEVESSIVGGYQTVNRYLTENEPDVLTQMTKPPIHGIQAGIPAWRDGTHFVYRYSGDGFYGYRIGPLSHRIGSFLLNNILGKIPLRVANSYVTLGPQGKRRLVKRNVDPDEVTVLPPSIDMESFRTNQPVDTDWTDDGPVALFVGRLNWTKGLRTLEDAIPQILDRRKDINFVLIGDGPNKLDIPDEYDKNVSFTGFVSPDRIPAYLSAADLLIHPSFIEGTPRAVLEALASGLPVVARDVGDVALLTDNTFESTNEFVRMVCDFESLTVDSVNEFSQDHLRNSHVEFYRSIASPGE